MRFYFSTLLAYSLFIWWFFQFIPFALFFLRYLIYCSKRIRSLLLCHFMRKWKRIAIFVWVKCWKSFGQFFVLFSQMLVDCGIFLFLQYFFPSLIFSYIVQFRDIFGVRFVCIYLSSWWFIIHLFFRYQHPYHSIGRTELFNRVLYAWWKYCSRFGQQLWNVRAAICSISQTNHFLAMSTDEGEYFASNSIHLVASNRIISTWPPSNHNIDLFIEYIKLNIRKKKNREKNVTFPYIPVVDVSIDVDIDVNVTIYC